MKVECDQCGKEVERYSSDMERNEHNFCSKECFNKWRSKKVKVECDWCGKEFEKIPSKVHKYNFCCQDHLYKWRYGEVKLEMEGDLAYLIGLFIADGCATSESRTFWTIHKKEDMQTIADLLENTLGVPPSSSKRKNKNLYDVGYNRKKVYNFFSYYKYEEGWQELLGDYFYNFLAGFIDGDGYLTKEIGRVGISNTNLSLLKAIRERLKEDGFSSSIRDMKDGTYTLLIGKHRNYLPLLRKLNLRYRKKEKRKEKYLQHHFNWIGGTKKQILKVLSRDGEQTSKELTKKVEPRRRTVQRHLRDLEKEGEVEGKIIYQKGCITEYSWRRI